MMATRISEVVARPARGAGQGGAGWIVTETIEAFGIYDFTEKQYGLSVFILGVVFSFLQTLIENRLGKAFLRQIPPKDSPLSSSVEDDGLAAVPEPEQTNNGPRPEDPVEQPPQDPDYLPPSDEIEPVDDLVGDELVEEGA